MHRSTFAHHVILGWDKSEQAYLCSWLIAPCLSSLPRLEDRGVSWCILGQHKFTPCSKGGTPRLRSYTSISFKFSS